MIYELCPERFHIVSKLLKSDNSNIELKSVIENNNPGWVFVDKVVIPRAKGLGYEWFEINGIGSGWNNVMEGLLSKRKYSTFEQVVYYYRTLKLSLMITVKFFQSIQFERLTAYY